MVENEENRIKVSLSQREIDTYNKEGLVIPGYKLPPGKLAQLQAGLSRLIKDNPNIRGEKLISAHLSENPGEGVRGNRIFFDFASDPDILDLLECLIGPDIILWGAQVFCKPAGDGKEVPWHQDGHYWPIRPLATCTVWVAIDDSTRENGAMRYIPGSHKSGLYQHSTDSSTELALNQVLASGQVDETQARDDELEAGQLSLHDVYLVHGSPPNRSSKRRAGFALRYMPGTAYFDHNIPSRDRVADFSRRPIFLLRGVDRTGRNDFKVGHADL